VHELVRWRDYDTADSGTTRPRSGSRAHGAGHKNADRVRHGAIDDTLPGRQVAATRRGKIQVGQEQVVTAARHVSCLYRCGGVHSTLRRVVYSESTCHCTSPTCRRTDELTRRCSGPAASKAISGSRYRLRNCEAHPDQGQPRVEARHPTSLLLRSPCSLALTARRESTVGRPSLAMWQRRRTIPTLPLRRVNLRARSDRFRRCSPFPDHHAR
jgi:hypothetical protein